MKYDTVFVSDFSAIKKAELAVYELPRLTGTGRDVPLEYAVFNACNPFFQSIRGLQTAVFASL